MSRGVGTELGGAGVEDVCSGVSHLHPAPMGSNGLPHPRSHSGSLRAGANELLTRFGKSAKIRILLLQEADHRARCRVKLRDLVVR